MSSPPPREPRIVIALPEGSVKERLRRLLAERDLDLTSVDHEQVLAAMVDASDSDVVIVRRQDLTPQDREHLDDIAKDENAPDVVVLAADVEEAEHVDLVTAGATEVVDVAQLDHVVADTLETLASGQGGHGAPDELGTSGPSLSDFVSRSKRMNAVLDLAQRVAPSDSILLITGETGVGKEHLARAIHAASPRDKGPFVAVNCGALPEELLESELFGHAKGAFTGANKERKGYFQTADGGTLLLDEIGEMPRHVQVKLLRVLQRGEVRPVGADQDVQVDVRILAATNRDLREEVAAGTFREDLFYRLNVVELRIPPLRERPEDLPTLIGSLMRHLAGRMGTHDVEGIEEAAVEALLQHPWPGNIRELINALERAVLVCRGSAIDVADLPRDVVHPPSGSDGDDSLGHLPAKLLELPWAKVREEVLRHAERDYLDTVLTECCGTIKDAAKRAGLSPRSLYDKMKRHELDKADYRQGESSDG